ncbi:MAG: T9SS type A sorting domain-containing protein [Paludibacteraceae bacterium]|nr:T9SS type A sorting domain-containing protein [Paludibacteraceae bacterium]
MKQLFLVLLLALVFGFTYAATSSTGGLTEITSSTISTDNGYKFHIYSPYTTFNRGFSEVYVTLTDSSNNYVHNFQVGNFFPKDSLLQSAPVGSVTKADSVHYNTWLGFTHKGSWTLSFKDTIGTATARVDSIPTDTETVIGFFKDRDCVGSVTLPLTRSCGIGCATGTGGMASCWNSGLGVFIYNPAQSGIITKDSARTDAHFLLADVQSKELIRAFVESLPTAASGKISVKVTGYRVKNGIGVNKSETYAPELTTDSIDHYLNAFHILSIEGTYISGLTSSYTGFATKTYKLTPSDLAPSKLLAVNNSGSATVKFTAPVNQASSKSTLKGYKVKVYNKAGTLIDSYTTTVNDSSVTSVTVSGFKANQQYTYTVSGLYPGSGVAVESGHSSVVADSVSGINLTIPDSTYYTKWIDSFKYQDTTYYLTVAYPKSIVATSQTVKAYINKQVSASRPYQQVKGGFIITPTPFMESMTMGSDGSTNLTWDSTSTAYKGTINFSMTGDWLVNLQVYKASNDSLVAGTAIDEVGDGSTINWQFYLTTSTGIKEVANTADGILVYPTLSHGQITVVTPAAADIRVLDVNGSTLATYQSAGTKTINLGVPLGVYFVWVQNKGKVTVQKIFVNQ